jgi:ubiquitin C-terminal hydrolase
MNASLNSLMACNELMEYFKSSKWVKDAEHAMRKIKDKNYKVGDKNEIDKYIAKEGVSVLFCVLISQYFASKSDNEISKIVFMERVCDMYKMEEFCKRHCDAEEFIGWLINRIHEETKYSVTFSYPNMPIDMPVDKKELFDMSIERYKSDNLGKTITDYEYSEIKKMFMFQIFQILKPNSEPKNFYAFANNNKLELSIFETGVAETISLPDLIYNNFEHGEVDTFTVNSVVYKSLNCKLFFWNLPPVLIVRLKRFTYDLDGYKKNNSNVKIDINIDVKKYCSEIYPHGSYAYSSFAVIFHSGSVYGGHYYAKVKHGDTWYNHDDSIITKIEPNPDYFENEGSFTPYVIFYSKNK